MVRTFLALLVVVCLYVLGAPLVASASAEEDFPDGPGMGADPGIPPGFMMLFILVAMGGVAASIWRVSTARRMARDAGMDPDDATAVTLLSDDGLEATYLASRRGGHQPEPSAEPGPAKASERLQELEELRSQGLVTPEEYETRRRVIIDSI